MSKYDEPFCPEQVDEQIEALVYSEERSALSNARLVSQLHQMYDEESEIVAQVWARLSRQADQQRKESAGQERGQSTSFHVLHTEHVKGPQPMKSTMIENQKRKRHLRFFEMLAAVLIVIVLVGGMVLALKVRQSSLLAGKSTATPTSTRAAISTPGPVADSQAGIYAMTQKEIEHIDLKSGKTTGHFKSGFSSTPVIANGVIYFNEVVPANGTISGNSVFYIDAVNVITGKQLWRKEYGFGTLLLSNGILYDSSCNNVADAITCTIVGINASDGTQRWSYPTPQGSSWITTQDGVVYGVSYAHYFALNGTTGAPIWQKTLPNNSEANMTPLVSNRALYFLACSGNLAQDSSFATTPMIPFSDSPIQPRSGGSQNCGFSAFSATNGVELWHKPMNNALPTRPTVADGVIYVEGFSNNAFTLTALNINNGSTIWTYQADGFGAEPVLVSNGIIYMRVFLSTGNTARLLALDATTRALKWSKDLTSGNSGAQGFTSVPTQPLASGAVTGEVIGSRNQAVGSSGTQSFTNGPAQQLSIDTPDQPLSGGGSTLNAPLDFALDSDTGLIYVLTTGHTVSAFHADTGTLVRNYSFNSSNITGFVLVTQNN